MDARDKARPRSPLGLILLLALALLLQGGLLLLFHLERAEAETERKILAERLEEEERRLAHARGDAEVLKAAVGRLEQETGELIARKTELSLDVAAKEAELARLKSTHDELEKRMQSEIKRGDIKLTQVDGRLQVDLIDKILFDSGEATISKRGEEVLARVGAVLATIEDKQILVSGHTDDSPPTAKIADRFPTNWELSVARATNVVRFLEEKAKVRGNRLVASGHGQYRPVATNITPTGRARNRRIEILLMPLIEPVKREKRAR